jgi:hypothetical protein
MNASDNLGMHEIGALRNGSNVFQHVIKVYTPKTKRHGKAGEKMERPIPCFASGGEI